MLHGFGVVCGLTVSAPGEADPPWQVTVGPGFALTPSGDEIVVAEAVRLDLLGGLGGSADGRGRAYVALRFVEVPSRPVPTPDGPEASRIRETFEVAALLPLPPSHASSLTARPAAPRPAGDTMAGDCSGALLTEPNEGDAWVVLAEVSLPPGSNDRIRQNMIAEGPQRRAGP